MKILQINTEKGWRGGERQTLFTMKGLDRAYVLREHSLEEMTRRYIRLYRQVLNPAAQT